MGRGRKGKATHSEKEHMVTAESEDKVDTKNEECPLQPNIPTIDKDEKIRELEEKVKALEQDLSYCRSTCDCHGKKGNIGHENQMMSQESDVTHHPSKEKGARKKQHIKNTGKVVTSHQHINEQSIPDAQEMFSKNMSRKKASKEVYQGNYANPNQVDLVHEHDSVEAGACSMDYQIEGTIKERASSETAEQQDSASAVDNWEDFDYDNASGHQVPQDEESFSEMEGGKAFGVNDTNLGEHPHRYYDNQNYYHSKKYQRKENWNSRSNTFSYSREKDNGKHPYNNDQNIITEVDGDLFSAPGECSLAHCVAADLCMGSGIAVTFKQKFKRVDELMGQRKKVGEVAILEDDGRFIYYLITKKYSTMKPRMDDLRDSVYEMKKHIVKNGVTKLAIPRIGCGLDRLHWRDVKKVLIDTFKDVDISITVYNFTEDTSLDTATSKTYAPTSKIKLRVKEEKKKLVDMESYTYLLLFGCVSGDIDETMKDIDGKFSIILDYKKRARKMGEILEIHKRNETLCILIVKERANDCVSYPALTECLKKLLKCLRSNGGYYMGFEAFADCNDGDDKDLTVRKIVNIFKIIFAHYDSELWICWPPGLEHIYENYQRVCQYWETNQYRDSNQYRESHQFRESNRHWESNQYKGSNQRRESSQYSASNQHRESNQYGESNQRRGSNQYGESNQRRGSNQYAESNQPRESNQHRKHESELCPSVSFK